MWASFALLSSGEPPDQVLGNRFVPLTPNYFLPGANNLMNALPLKGLLFESGHPYFERDPENRGT